MKSLMRLLFAVALGALVPATTFGQGQESSLAGYRYVLIPFQTFDNGEVNPYDLAKEIRQILEADTSWQVLTDVQVTTERGTPAKVNWQTVLSSKFIGQDRIKLAQTVLLYVYTPGGRFSLDAWIVVTDILGRELARFKGVSGRTGLPSRRIRDAVRKAVTQFTERRPQFKSDLSRGASTKKLALDEAEVRNYLGTAPNLSPIEGIWIDVGGMFRLAITREQETRQFTAVVLASKHPFWDVGMVKARFEPTADPVTLISHYIGDDHEERTVTFRIERGSLITRDNFALSFARLNTGESRPLEASAPAPSPAIPTPAPTSGPTQAGTLLRIGTGTAFVVGDNLIATNFHVIEDGTAWELRFPPRDEPLALELVVADKANDLAVMRIKGPVLPLRPLSVVAARTARLGEDVYSVGFPLTGLLSDGHKVSTGVVSGLAGLDNDPRFFQLTVPTQPGNSGGPIFNGKGDVVGVLASTLSVDYLYKETRSIPQNVNFAIKSDYLMLLVAQADAGATVMPVGPLGVSRVDQIANVQGSIGLVSTFAADKPRNRVPDASTRATDAPLEPKVPSLQVTYRNPTGPQILIKQSGANATITFYRADSSIFGNGSVSWNAATNAFVGFSEIPYVCGSIDTRVITVKAGLELFLESGGTLRMRSQVPSGINCSQNRVDLNAWGEDRWYP